MPGRIQILATIAPARLTTVQCIGAIDSVVTLMHSAGDPMLRVLVQQ